MQRISSLLWILLGPVLTEELTQSEEGRTVDKLTNFRSLYAADLTAFRMSKPDLTAKWQPLGD